ncbi:hypothetical protein BH11BAC1_BH11BAC1_23000 [soil metagenome]
MSQAKIYSGILILAVASTIADAQLNANTNLNPTVMSTADFTTVILVDQSPAEAFKAITNVRGWWSEEIEGTTDKLNEVFYYHFEDVHHCTIKLIEVIPNEKIVWHVLDNYFKFTKDKTEWNDTKVSFEISKVNDQTQIRFTHIGLVPDYECFPICRDAWTTYIQKSLRNLIVTGKGNPNGTNKPQTENEKRLINNK